MFIGNYFATNTVVYAFKNSDGFGQLIVVAMGFISAYLWILMIEKHRELTNQRKKNSQFNAIFENSERLLNSGLATAAESPYKNIYTDGIHKIMYLSGVNSLQAEESFRLGRLPKELNPIEVEIVMSVIEHSISNEQMKLEEGLGHLATIVAASPFFGLLGTVWGVMSAFCGMAQQNSADIGALAPGISGALLTTVVGLLVAIPSLIGYNLLTKKLDNLESSMEIFVNSFGSKLKTEVGHNF